MAQNMNHVPWPKLGRPRKMGKRRLEMSTSAKAVLRLLLKLVAVGDDGMTHVEIREFCGCARRQAYRHLEALRDVGIPIESFGDTMSRRHRIKNCDIVAWSANVSV